MGMSIDARTVQEQLTPEARRGLLRAFADRMLLKVSAMDDPEDMPGVEKAVRVAAVIERIYYRCDRSEHHAPDPYKCEAERAQNAEAAIKSRFSLANTLQWEDRVHRTLEPWIGAAKDLAKPQTDRPVAVAVAVPAPPAPEPGTATPEAAPAPAPVPAPSAEPLPQTAPDEIDDYYIDCTEDIDRARALLGLPPAPDDPSIPPPIGRRLTSSEVAARRDPPG